jgi:hypothetical protein
MPRADRVIFESVAGDLLAKLGYETEGIARPLGRVERFFRASDNVARWVIHKIRVDDRPPWIKSDRLVFLADLLRHAGLRRPDKR